MAAISTMENIQWRNSAAAGLCSGCSLGDLGGQMRCVRRIHGVVVLLAKKRKNGRMPSLAISCLTAIAGKMSVTDYRKLSVLQGTTYLLKR